MVRDDKNATETQVKAAIEEIMTAIENLREKMHYKDVHEDDWFFNQVEYAYDNDIMTGFEDDVFGSYVTCQEHTL